VADKRSAIIIPDAGDDPVNPAFTMKARKFSFP
jgi:hypothetical protein